MNESLPSTDVGGAAIYVESGNQQTSPPLRECVTHALQDYFEQLDGHPTTNMYEMLMTEVEVPLFKSIMVHTNGNQSRAAEILGINRGTLRKKLKLYGL